MCIIIYYYDFHTVRFGQTQTKVCQTQTKVLRQKYGIKSAKRICQTAAENASLEC